MSKVRRFARNNGLSPAIFGLFITFLCAESVAGLFAYNDDRKDHSLPAVSYAQFLTSGRFVEATLLHGTRIQFGRGCRYAIHT